MGRDFSGQVALLALAKSVASAEFFQCSAIADRPEKMVGITGLSASFRLRLCDRRVDNHDYEGMLLTGVRALPHPLHRDAAR